MSDRGTVASRTGRQRLDNSDNVAGLDDEVQSHTTRPRPASRRIGLRFAALLALLAVLIPLPTPARAVGLVVVGVLLPIVLWGRLVGERFDGLRDYRVGAGIIATLSGWTLVELVLLAVRLGANTWTSALALLLVCATPLVLNTPMKRPTGTAAWLRAAAGPAVAVAVGFGAGAALLAWSMRLNLKYTDSILTFNVFWLGVLAVTLPCLWLAFRRADPLPQFCLIVLGISTFIPTFMRSPLAPNQSDELAHWGETKRMMADGLLFQPDPVVSMGPKYPGLETLTTGVARLAALSPMNAGHLVVALAGIATAFGIAALARTIGASRRGSLVAGALYVISPQAVMFHQIYSYESLAVPLAVWFLVAVVCLSQRTHSNDRWTVPAVVTLGAALLVTHHLTTFGTAGIVITLAVIALVRPRGELRWVPLAICGIGLTALGTAWAVAVNADLPVYLGNYLKYAAQGIHNFVSGTSGTSPDVLSSNTRFGSTRELFGGSVLPTYERITAYVVQPLLAVWFAYAVWTVRKRLSTARLGFALVGLAYFASLPLTLLSGAGSGAHRSWALSFIGISIILSLAIDRPSAISKQRVRFSPALLTGVGVLCSVAILVASFASEDNAARRLPGPFQLGADGRTFTAATVRAAQWFERTQGSGQTVITNHRTLTVFGSYGDAVEPPFPQWLIFYPTTEPDPTVVHSFLSSGINYVIVDSELAKSVPVETYFGTGEPPAPSVPLPQASLTKFDTLPWLSRIHTDGNITIYKVRH